MGTGKTVNKFWLLLSSLSTFVVIKEIGGAASSATLDPDGKYQVTWEIDEMSKTITFETTVETIGFVGFGISPTGGMTGADIVIGGISPDGSPYFQDQYAEANGMPMDDDHQDWTLLESSQNGTFTYLKFSRAISTCDDQDVEITGDAQYFIWAIGQDDKIKYHEAERGSFVLNILDPPTPEIDLSEYQSFDAVSNIKMPSDETSYWCSVHRSPVFLTKQHTIAFGPKIIDPVAQRHSHHLTFTKCKAPAGIDNPDAFFESFIIPGGQDCFSGTGDRSLEIYSYCGSMVYSWAMGARIMHMPEGVGFPISKGGGREYFLLEMHLSNPDRLRNIEFESGVQVYHTDDLRPIEAGTIAISSNSNWQFVIPPNSQNFLVSAHCTAACTEFIEPDGYTLFNVQLHAHNSARTMRLRQFRDDDELPWIADDQMYDNGFQNNRNIQPVQLLPGDHITLECGYDNTWLKPPAAVFGGYSTKEEMCASVIYYYPKGRFVQCGSANYQYRLMDLIGIKRISDGLPTNKTSPIILAPQELFGTSVQEYMNSVVNWTKPLRRAVAHELKFGPHDPQCKVGRVDRFRMFLALSEIPTTYPLVKNVYKRVDECLSEDTKVIPNSVRPIGQVSKDQTWFIS